MQASYFPATPIKLHKQAQTAASLKASALPHEVLTNI